MLLVDKIKESCFSVAPILVLVSVLHGTVTPLGDVYPRFLIGGFLLIFGLGIFLLGADIALVPIGQKIGATLTGKRNITLMTIAGLFIGIIVTVAEPDVQVLAHQVAGVAPDISPEMLIGMISIGVGLFTALAIIKTVLRLSLKPLLLILYLILFGCAFMTHPAFLGVAFDAGGATTGPMTVPFIMALGLGIASVYSRKDGSADQSFGFIGLASIGPVLAVLCLGIFASPVEHMGNTAAAPAAPEALSLAGHFLHLVGPMCHEVSLSLLPLILLIALFHFLMLHLPPIQLVRTIVGFIYTFVGMIIFFIGVKGGFTPAGELIGQGLANLHGGMWLVPAGVLLGALVVCAEPAVWVLNHQVEEVSGGHINATIMLVSLSVGVAVAVGLALLRVWLGMSLWTLLIPGYLLTFACCRFCPTLFTAIAFDSGGVASGPMASTFILSFTLGASRALGGNPMTDAFGVIAMIAMTPLITIQILGILYGRKLRLAEELKKKSQGEHL